MCVCVCVCVFVCVWNIKYKNQTKNPSVLAKIYKVYIIRAPISDAFGNIFFSLLSIMECYKPSR